MLQPISHILSTQKIILASGSPRRKQILENIGLKFEVVPSTFPEDLDKGKFAHPAEYVEATARVKALEVAQKFTSNLNPPDLVIGADTVVSMDDKIYEKPTDRQNAFDMLSKFSGGSHTVYTGVCFVQLKSDHCGGDNTDQFNVTVFHEGTDVTMAEMSPNIINSYIDTGEPMDKAGGYGIQALGGTLVRCIKGDYFNVMGFPLHKFSKELLELYST